MTPMTKTFFNELTINVQIRDRKESSREEISKNVGNLVAGTIKRDGKYMRGSCLTKGFAKESEATKVRFSLQDLPRV